MQQRPQLNRPTAFKVGSHTFVCGLHWALLASKRSRSEALKREADEMKKLGGPTFEIATVRNIRGKGGQAQAGFSVRSGNVRTGAYSAASVVAHVLGNDFVAAIPIDPKSIQYVLVAAREGAILPMQDALLGREEAKARFLELVAAMAADEIRIVCPDNFAVPDSEDWTFERVIAEAGKPKIAAQHKLSALTTIMAIRSRVPLILTGMVILGGLFGWTEYQAYIDGKERERLDAQLREEEARRLAAEGIAAQPIREITRPWVTQALPDEFVAHCGHTINAVPLALDGWTFTSLMCDGKAIHTVYSRVPGATVDSAITSAALFGLPSPAIDDAGDTATISIALSDLRPGGEDPLPPRDVIRNRFITLAQGVGASFTLTDIPDPPPPNPPVEPGQPPPPPPPPPPWRSMTFSFQMDERIEIAVPALLSMPGVRVTSIAITRSGSTLSYTTTGELHAQR